MFSACSSVKGDGITDVLDDFIKFVPTPAEHEDYDAKNDADEDIKIKVDPAGKPAAFVFKTIADPFLGKISLAKVISGTLKSGQEIYNARAQKSEKLGSMFFVRGKNQVEAPVVEAGDIVAIAKLQFTEDRRHSLRKGKHREIPACEIPCSCTLHSNRA